MLARRNRVSGSSQPHSISFFDFGGSLPLAIGRSKADTKTEKSNHLATCMRNTRLNVNCEPTEYDSRARTAQLSAFSSGSCSAAAAKHVFRAALRRRRE